MTWTQLLDFKEKQHKSYWNIYVSIQTKGQDCGFMLYLLSRSSSFSNSDSFVYVILISLQRFGHFVISTVMSKHYLNCIQTVFFRKPCNWSMVPNFVAIQDVRTKQETSNANKYIAVVKTVL